MLVPSALAPKGHLPRRDVCPEALASAVRPPGRPTRTEPPYTGAVPGSPPRRRGRSGNGDRRYEGRNFAGAGLPGLTGAALIECRFEDCELAGASLRGAHLSDCTFRGCELSLADLTDALVHGCRFQDCRLTGVDFASLRPDPLGFGAEFERCDLTLAGFHGLDLRGCAFRSCSAREAEFVDCDLREVDLTGSDLAGVVFRQADLRNADLRGTRDVVLDPCHNRVAGLRIDLPGALGLLSGLSVRLEG